MTIAVQKRKFENILRREGMPPELRRRKEEKLVPPEEIEQGTMCDALHDLLDNADLRPEEFRAAMEIDPEGLQLWVERQIGTLM